MEGKISMNMMSPWYAWRRRLDVWRMWPPCRDAAPDMLRAKLAFTMRTRYKRHWKALGGEKIDRIVERLS
jgi:hypothetical protein